MSEFHDNRMGNDLEQKMVTVKRCCGNNASPKLYFGVESKQPANVLLQNNLDLFEWVVRNKMYPDFWGRSLFGNNCLSKDEITYIQKMGCAVVAICNAFDVSKQIFNGSDMAVACVCQARDLGIPVGSVVFLSVDDMEAITTNILYEFAYTLSENGFVAGFKANTDAKYSFDREFSRGMQIHKEVFENCLVWATSPIIQDYDRIATTHLIHPDVWKPFAPSGISRAKISIWQYGKDCHPIYADNDALVTFNINLVKNREVITKKMF